MNFEYTDIEVVKYYNMHWGKFYFSAGWTRFFRSRFSDTARFIGSVDNSQPYPLNYYGWFVFTESGEYSSARAKDKALSAFLAADNPSFEPWSLTPERD